MLTTLHQVCVAFLGMAGQQQIEPTVADSPVGKVPDRGGGLPTSVTKRKPLRMN